MTVHFVSGHASNHAETVIPETMLFDADAVVLDMTDMPGW